VIDSRSIVLALLAAIVALSPAIALAAPSSPAAPAPPAPRPNAPQGAQDPAAVIDEVLDLSGAREALVVMEKELREILGKFAEAGKLGEPDAIRVILEREITRDRLRALLAANLRASYEAARFEKLLALVRQPLSKRMTELEVAAMNATPDQMQVYAATAAKTEEGRERLRLGERLDAAMQATKSAPDALTGAMRGVARALNEILPPNQRITGEQLEADRRRAEAEMQDAVKASLVYTYREATIDEITRYLGDLESELGQWWVGAQREAVLHAAQVVAESAMRQILQLRRLPRT
jgi:hypothetical protein